MQNGVWRLVHTEEQATQTKCADNGLYLVDV